MTTEDMTTELAVIPSIEDSEVVEIQQLTKTQAKALDKKIRTASDRVTTSTENLLELLEQAAAGQIHVALELPSWTAWFKDAVQIQVSDRHDRKELVKLMSGKGMSQRAIAGTLGVSQKTVDRDLDGEEFDTDTVTGLDGAERPRNGKPLAAEDDTVQDEPLDVEFDEVPEPPVQDMTAADIVEVFGDEVTNLWSAHSELCELTREAKWGNARRRIATNNLNNLQDIITALQSVVDDLMTGGGA